MTPRNARLNSNRPKSQISNQFMPAESPLPSTLSRVENFENELAYVDLQEFENLRTGDGLRGGNAYRTPPRHNPPRCCDVPALQSPKNAVAPTQTIIATSNTGTDYSNNIQRMKTALADQPGLVTKKEHENNKLNQISSQDDKAVLAAAAIIPMHNGQASSTEASSSSRDRCSQGSIVNGLTSNGPQSQIFLNGMHGTPCSSNGIQGKNNHNVNNNSSIGQPSSNNGPFGKNGIHLSSNHSPACSYQFPENIDQCIDRQTCAYCSTKLKDPKSHEQCGKASNTCQQSTSSCVTTVSRVDEMRFIDEESRGEVESFDQSRGVHRTQTVVSIGPLCVNDSIVRSCSVGYLDMVDAQLVPCNVALKMLRKEAPNKRLVLVSRKTKRRKKNKAQQEIGQQTSKSPRLRNCGKSKSLDSSDIFPANEQIALPPKLPEHAEEAAGAVNLETVEDKSNESLEKSADAAEILDESAKLVTGSVVVMSAEVKPSNRLKSCNSPVRGSSPSGSLASSLDGLAARLRDFDESHSLPPPSPRPSTRLPRSSPSSPAPSKKGKRPASASPIRRRLLSSPLLSRKPRKSRGESSDEEGLLQDDSSTNYRDLETFQKAQLRQKLKQKGGGISGHKSEAVRRELVMHNKAPMWNESSQVYQLDFGGRVTQESAKNFQIEFKGRQVMQFGRIDGNAYTLDFQYPFSALQAFAVALANVTQRLK